MLDPIGLDFHKVVYFKNLYQKWNIHYGSVCSGTAQVSSSRSIGKAGKNDTNVLNFANAIRQMYKL